MAKKRINREKNVEKGVVTFTDITSGDSLSCDVTKLFPKFGDYDDVQKNLILHAVNAKVGDSAADPTVAAVGQMQKTWEQLLEGVWAARSSGEGGGKATILAEAIAAVQGLEVAAVVARLEEMSDEDKKALRNHVQVKAAITAIRAEREATRAKAAKAAAKGAEPLNF